MTSKKRAEALAHYWIISELEERFVNSATRAIDEAVAEAVKVEREACVDALRPDYPDAVAMLIRRRGSK